MEIIKYRNISFPCIVNSYNVSLVDSVVVKVVLMLENIKDNIPSGIICKQIMPVK
jgi:hypothetical protein